MKVWFNCLAGFLLFLASCNKEGTDTIPTGNGVYISNEGNFNFGSAEISFYQPDSMRVSNNLFRTANNYMLGDVAQSIFIKDSFAFIVVNNSQKIEVVRVPSLQHVLTITLPGSSPRYFLPLNDSIAYVTELYAGKVHVINYKQGTLIKDITGMAKWTEHMVSYGNYVIVEERNLDAHPSSHCTVAQIDINTHSVIKRDTFDGINIGGIVKDMDGRIWVAVEQDSVHAVPSTLQCLNGDLSTYKVLTFPMGHHPANLSVNGAGDKLYLLDKDVRSLLIADTAAPAIAFIASNNRNFYALGISPVTEEIYVTDALDFIQSSRIYRYDKNGQLIHNFTAGIISGNFTFKND